jgi:hypothetical protein
MMNTQADSSSAEPPSKVKSVILKPIMQDQAVKPGIFSNSSLWTSWSERESLKNKSLASSFLSQSSVFLQAEENGFPNQLTSCKSPFPFLKMTR